MSSLSTRDLLDWLTCANDSSFPEFSSYSQSRWDALIAASIAHTVAPQLFARLSSAPNVPAAAVQAAFVAFVWQKKQSTRAANDIAAALAALSRRGIRTLALKGAHLAALAYAEPSHRPMSDLDVLVTRNELTEAADALEGLGYHRELPIPLEDWLSRSREVRMMHEHALLVELHWAIADPRDPVTINHDDLWTRSQETTIFGVKTRVLCAEDLLLHVSFHAGISHQFAEKGLRPLFDVLAILQAYSIDWSTLWERARAWRTERVTALMLHLAKREGGATIPHDVPAVDERVYRAARDQMFEAPGVNMHPIAPRSIALAWTDPRSMWDHLFAPRKRRRDSVTGEMHRYASAYVRFAWKSLVSNRGLLVAIARRVRRHLVLSSWLANEGSVAKL